MFRLLNSFVNTDDDARRIVTCTDFETMSGNLLDRLHLEATYRA